MSRLGVKVWQLRLAGPLKVMASRLGLGRKMDEQASELRMACS